MPEGMETNRASVASEKMFDVCRILLFINFKWNTFYSIFCWFS